MSFSPECQELLRSLAQSTARLAALNPEDFEQVARALQERGLAVTAMAGWIAREQSAARPIRPELALHIQREFDRGADVVVRLALTRAATLRDLNSIHCQLQLLHSLRPAAFEPSVIDCRG